MPRPSGIVAFISDFGLRDPYVGVVHAVLESLGAGRIRVIDVAHELPAFSIQAGAYMLYTSYRYFSRGTVFLVVVDPGVGSERRPVVIVTRNYFFVGPDNGVLWPAASEDGIVNVYVIENDALMLKPVSASFHGRDVFAPTAAFIALGGDPSTVGRRLDPSALVKLELLTPCKPSNGRLDARVVYIDRFGNVALSLKGEECYRRLCRKEGKRLKVCVKGSCTEAVCARVFSVVEQGTLVLYLNSFWFLELAVNLGSAAEKLNVSIGDEVTIETLG